MPDFFWVGLTLSLTTGLALARKWALGIPRTAVTLVGLSLLTAWLIDMTPFFQRVDSIALKGGANWFLTLAAAFALLAYAFYRDPERTIPITPSVIVSPADGEVLYLRTSRDGVLPVSTKNGHTYTLQELTKTPLQMRAAAVIGIGMTFLDVHVNRAPIAGQIASQQHFAGLFGSLRRLEMVFENSRVTTIIERDDLQVAVVQIASRLVRQIVSFVHEHQAVKAGERIGVIRFGSQVDLVLPCRADLEVTVKPGDRVRAGESIVAVLRDRDSHQSGLPPP